ncbi:MAG TPA: HAMP domain-containing sensor histidine kinase [Vicinamibacteria bacterium]|jgi:signal transduction histidine kinase
MSETRIKTPGSDDPRGRLIAIFAGAVLLPSLALSYVSVHFVNRLASTHEATKIQRAEKTLYYIEKDLVQSAHAKALEAARGVGPDRLLDARPEAIQAALQEEGMGEVFESMRLEASTPRALRAVRRSKGWDTDIVELLDVPEEEGEDFVAWTTDDGQVAGTLRFKFACDFVHKRLIKHYFENDFVNPDGALVVRVSEPEGPVVYETAKTRTNRFEVHRKMESPSFKGLKLSLRYRDLSIREDVQRWKVATLCVIGFIDLMLGAGLLLVYGNVRREMHLSRIKSDFVANVSHELKTPLALIRLFAETLEMGRVPSPEKAGEYHRIINKESQRLTQLINNILDFSRIEAGRKEYRFAPVDVAEVVREVLEAYRFQIEKQGFTLEAKVPADLPLVEADKEALEQALLNLVHNAVKYSPHEKYLGLEVRREGDHLLVAVADRGIGVAKGEQKKIFDKFYRSADSLVHDTKGSGLGLTLVRHIMEAHGGRVELESTPGKGSTFTLVLPISQGGS